MNGSLNGQVVAFGFSWTAMSGCAPVTNRGDFQHLLFAIKVLKTVMDHLPDAVNL
jgi:hypothetical protein